MIKKNKGKLLLSSMVILLPMIFGLIVWKKLPEQMTTHWGASGNADGWSSRNFAVFGIPLFLLLVHWLCIIFTWKDPKNKNQNNKIFGVVLGICPVVSLLAGIMIYAEALGKTIEPYFLASLFVGLFFVIIGNYLPKCKQNHTIGIKVKWALENEENWNATHRFAGKAWVIGGILIMACSFMPEETSTYVLLFLIIALALLTGGYSYCYSKKN